jgi:P pilus assembly chaperone PapD
MNTPRLTRVSRCAASRVALGTVVMLGSASVALAQSVEVSPLRVELAMTPGSTHTEAVTLTNQGDTPVRVRARLQDWFMAKDGTPQFDAPVPGAEREFVGTSWVRIAPPEQIVQPGQQGIVRFTTAAPAGASEGGYRAAILFEFGSPTADPLASRRSVQFRSRIATLVYMGIGKPMPKVELTDLASRVGGSEGPAVIATLKNTSRATTRTKGSITLRDNGGQLVRTIVVPDVPLLPMSERDVAIALGATGQSLPAGEYRVEVKIDVGMPEVLVGEMAIKVP